MRKGAAQLLKHLGGGRRPAAAEAFDQRAGSLGVGLALPPLAKAASSVFGTGVKAFMQITIRKS